MKTLLLIDANSLVHRAFHALPPLTNYKNEPSQAIYGVSRILIRLWREARPDYAAALFDRPEPTFRDELYADYKGHRPEAPDGLIPQLIEAHYLFPLFGIKVFEKAGFEADDLIASFAERFKNEDDLRVVIFTGDLDSLQLIEEGKISVRVPQKGISETTIYDPEAVKERYGLYPESLPDYKALVGDASDNIKGVSGIGPKTAAKMLQKYKHLEELVAHLPEEPEFSAKLAPHLEQAKLSKRLVLLRRDAPVEAELPDLATKEAGEELRSYFEENGFTSLLKQLDSPAPEEKPKKKEGPKASQGSFF